MIRRVATVAALLCLSLPTLTAQQAPGNQAGAGVVAGALTSPDGEPVRKATVRLVSAAPRLSRTTTTDADGRFAFTDLPAAEYTLSATRTGFLEMVYGARQAGPGRPGTPIRLIAGQKLDNLSMTLPRGGVIAGQVRDEFGDPAFNVSVRALRLGYSNGERTVSTGGSATTDDLGAYRIAGLLPGEYLVTAVPRDTVATAAAQAEVLAERMAQLRASAQAGTASAKAEVARIDELAREGRGPEAPPTSGYVAVYYPGTPSPGSAVRVQVGLSQQVFGIDMGLQIVETATVSGFVQDAEGRTIPGNVQLVDPAMPVSNAGVWFRYPKTGVFSFAGIVPGSYVLRANNSPPGTIGGPPAAGGHFQMSAPMLVQVPAGGLPDVALRMVPGLTVSGRLDLASITAPVDASRVRVSLYPVTTPTDWEMAAYPTTPDAEGRFAIQHIVSGRYRVAAAGLPEGWIIDSAIFNGRDAADHLLTIEPDREYTGVVRFTNRLGRIGGAVTNAMNAPVARQTVILFPEDRALWVPQSRRIQVALSGPDGRYAFSGLIHGRYRLAAVGDLESGQHFDREFLEGLVAGSIEILLGEGEQRVQDVTVR